jgi:hypothetical protein
MRLRKPDKPQQVACDSSFIALAPRRCRECATSRDPEPNQQRRWASFSRVSLKNQYLVTIGTAGAGFQLNR